MKHPVYFAVMIVFALVFSGVSISCNAQEKTPKGANSAKASAKAVSGEGFSNDFNAALATAKSEKKPVFVDFYTEWCGWCKKMDKDTYADPEIQKQIRDGWVALKIDAENDSQRGTFNGKSMTYREIGRFFNVNGYPSILFIDKDGKAVTVVPGYFPKKDFALLLKYFKEEMYTKKIDLRRYIENNR